jgi:hypothetical protein
MTGRDPSDPSGRYPLQQTATSKPRRLPGAIRAGFGASCMAAHILPPWTLLHVSCSPLQLDMLPMEIVASRTV